MKQIMTMIALLLSQVSFAGPSVSNGPTGQELLHCTGRLQYSKTKSTEVVLSLAPEMNQGLVATVGLRQHPLHGVFYTVQKIENDPRGLIYMNQAIKPADLKIQILIPAMQNPNTAATKFNAILMLPKISKVAAILDCEM